MGQHNPLKDQISAFYYEEDTRNWAGICKPIKKPGNRFPVGRYRFLGSLNVYKYRFWIPGSQSTLLIYKKAENEILNLYISSRQKEISLASQNSPTKFITLVYFVINNHPLYCISLSIRSLTKINIHLFTYLFIYLFT